MEAPETLVRLETFVLIAVGGFFGSNLRFIVSTLSPGIPGTLVVNVLGSTILGFVVYEAFQTGIIAEESRTVISTGFLSSFTTYSTFAIETVQADPLLGIANVVASYALGFLGVLLGRHVAVSIEVTP